MTTPEIYFNYTPLTKQLSVNLYDQDNTDASCHIMGDNVKSLEIWRTRLAPNTPYTAEMGELLKSTSFKQLLSKLGESEITIMTVTDGGKRSLSVTKGETQTEVMLKPGTTIGTIISGVARDLPKLAKDAKEPVILKQYSNVPKGVDFTKLPIPPGSVVTCGGEGNELFIVDYSIIDEEHLRKNPVLTGVALLTLNGEAHGWESAEKVEPVDRITCKAYLNSLKQQEKRISEQVKVFKDLER